MRTIALIVAALTVTAASMAQNSWDNLTRLRVGDPVHVARKGAGGVSGRFAAFSSDAITVETKSGQQPIPRADVKRVSLGRQSRRGRNAAVGGAIGAGALTGLMGIALAADGSGWFAGPILIGSAVAGGIAGAAVGALLPPRSTIYRAPKQP